MIHMKKAVWLFAATLFIFVSPQILFAGGTMKDKIQKKISESKSVQYEPYYLQSDYKVMREGSDGKVERSLGGAQAFSSQAVTESERVADSFQALPKERDENVRMPTPTSYAIYQTNYSAELEENVVTVKGKAVFEVFKKGWAQIPLVRSDVGLIDVSVNRGSAYVIMQNNKYYLMIDKPGRYNLNIEFLIKAAREREQGPGSFSFEVMPAPISQFEFTMPETGVDIFVDPAIRVELKKETNKTVAWAIMPNTSIITARWTKELLKEKIAPVKLEPKIYADTATYASVGEGIIRCQTHLNYSILQSEVSNFRIALPEDVSLLEVNGNDLRDWKVSKSEGLQYLDVYLNFGVKGNYALNLTYEKNIGEGSVVAEIPWVKTTATERESGYFGIAARTNVELATNKLDRVNLIDIKELPSSIWSSSASPILLAFKYLNHPFNITIEVTKHEELPVLIAAIDSANFVSLYTEEGKILTKATYQVRNNVKQFIRLALPHDSDLWSTFVAGKPVKPAKDKNGSILIPLEKSQFQGESLAGFPVEVVYLNHASKMQRIGKVAMDLPQTDIPISELDWSVYLPSDYSFFNFGGNVKPAEGYHPLGGPIDYLTRGVQGRLKASGDNIGEQFSPAFNQPMSAEQTAPMQMRGVLPIKINIPQQGQLLRFTKLLVTEKESPTLSMNYIGVLKHARGLFRIIIWAFIIFLAYKIMKRISKKK